MKDFNKVMLLGRLGSDPILRKTKSGISVAHFSLATGTFRTAQRPPEKTTTTQPDSVKNVSNDSDIPIDAEIPQGNEPLAPGNESHPSVETEWHKIVAWGKLAESCHSFLYKGASVFVEGSIRSHQYVDKNGTQKIAFEIYAENLSYLNTKRSQSEPSTVVAAAAS